MVILLTGDNAYQAAEEVRRLEREIGVTAERIGGDTLNLAKLADVMKGASLFATTRLVVIDTLSAQADLWSRAAEWTPLVDQSTTIVLRDEKPDKRTKAYKELVKLAKVIEVVSWTEKQHGLAEKWLQDLAKQADVVISRVQVRDMVSRSLIPGHKSGQRIIDQQMLAQAIQSLSGVGTVSDDMIDTILPTSTSDAVFDLLEIAVRRDGVLVRQRIDEVRLAHDGYQLLALVVAQWSQLTMLVYTHGEYAGDIHPFVKQKLLALAPMLTHRQVRELTRLAAQLDIDSKSTGLSPWDALERLLLGIAYRTN